jgi:hypothetical protein
LVYLVPDLGFLSGVLAGFFVLLAVPPAGFLAAGLVELVAGFFIVEFLLVEAGLSADDLVTGFFTFFDVGVAAVLAVGLMVDDVFPAAVVFFTTADGFAVGFPGVFPEFPTALGALTVAAVVLGVVLAVVLAFVLAVDFAGAFTLVFAIGSLAAVFFTPVEPTERVVFGLAAGFTGVAFVEGMPDFSAFLAGGAFSTTGFSAERVRFGWPSSGKANWSTRGSGAITRRVFFCATPWRFSQ